MSWWGMHVQKQRTLNILSLREGKCRLLKMPSVQSMKEPLLASAVGEMEKMLALFEQKSKTVGRKKAKLSQLKEKKDKGEKLLPEQLDKLNHSIGFEAQIELLKELTANVNATLIELRREKKDKDDELKAKRAEIERIRLVEMYRMNHVLDFLGDENVRRSIVRKADSGVKLTKEQLKNLDKFYKLVHPEVTAPDDAGKTEGWLLAARKLQLYMDSSRKKALSPMCTFYDIRQIVKSVYESSYITKPIPVEEPQPIEEPPPAIVAQEAAAVLEQEFIVVSQDDVPSADSQEVQDSLPSVVTPPTEVNITHNTEDTSCNDLQQPTLPEPLPSPQTFEKIVEKTQGSFNFIQVSQIEPQPLSLDPAVVSVQHMPNIPAQHNLAVDPSISHPQFMHPQSIPIPTTVIENSLYSQQAKQKYTESYETPDVYQDPPQPIPLPGETPGFQETFQTEPLAFQQPDDTASPAAEPVNDRVSPEVVNDPASAAFQAPKSRDVGFNRRGRGGSRGRGPPHNVYGRGGSSRGSSDRYNDRDQFYNRDSRDRFNTGERRGGRGGFRSDRGDRGGYRGQHGAAPRGGPKMARGGSWSNSNRGSAPPQQVPQSQ